MSDKLVGFLTGDAEVKSFAQLLPAGPKGDKGDKGDGWTDAYYTAGTGKVTFESDDGLGFVTGDLRGAKGDVGDMWKPSIDGAGNISWTQSSSTTAPTPTNIQIGRASCRERV